METLDSEVPLARRLRSVAILYNLKKAWTPGLVDAEVEYDSIDTVHAIQCETGKSRAQCRADRGGLELPERLRSSRAEIAFNIAEGLQGRGREAQIPALLNMLGIPFTGSDETALCVALDKAMCKKLAGAHLARTPRFRVAPVRAEGAGPPVPGHRQAQRGVLTSSPSSTRWSSCARWLTCVRARTCSARSRACATP